MLKTTGICIVLLLLLASVALLIVGQLGLLNGQRPADLGIRNGLFTPPDATKQNTVSSQAAAYPHTENQRIAPIAFTGDGKAAFLKLTLIVGAMDGATVITTQPHYLHAEFQSQWLKFVDDAEFSLDEKTSVIHMRSASRLGKSDLGVNRKRLEAIRTQFNR